MHRWILTLALALLLSVAGCVPSLHPLYTAADLVFDPALAGTWTQEGEKESWTFSARDGNSYTLVHTDSKGRAGTFTAHLLEVDGQRFIDLYPEDLDDAGDFNEFFTFHFLPTHYFLRVRQIEPTLQFTLLDYEWVKNYLADHPDAVEHEVLDDSSVQRTILLTDDPLGLQAFLLGPADTDDAWGDYSNMTRN